MLFISLLILHFVKVFYLISHKYSKKKWPKTQFLHTAIFLLFKNLLN
jgi:hypothetical protein